MINVSFWTSKKYFLCFGMSLLFVGMATSHASPTEAPATPSEVPYLQLYNLRLAQAEAKAQRAQSTATLATRHLDRIKSVYNAGAASKEEHDAATAEFVMADTELQLANLKVSEAQAYLQIIGALTKQGTLIPLCTYGLE